MKCENCKAIASYFNGEHTENYCIIGVSEEDAYNSEKDTWGCKYNSRTVNKRLAEMRKNEHYSRL